MTIPSDPEFLSRAAAHWTEERTRKVTAGRDYPILPGPGALLLRALGLQNRDASMPADAVRKYGQINHLVLLLEPSITMLCRQLPRVRVLDAGCGSSYLTYLLAWGFTHRWNHPAEILGVDSNPAVIKKCRDRLAGLGLDDILRFEVARIRDLEEEEPRRNAVVALHACDTATDEAVAFGIARKADLIAVAPCCQAELAQRWAALAGAHARGPLAPIWNSPHLRRDAAAVMTDALRLLLLRGAGYEVTAMEFVPSSHTPKNTLLRAVRRGNYLTEALAEYKALKSALGGEEITLESLLPEELRRRLAEV